MDHVKSIVVYCGSNPGNNALFMDVACQLGERLAENKIRLIYGGGNRGLMSRVADAALAKGGEVTGIIPNFLAKLEVAHKGLTEIHFVETMHQRKAEMVKLADAALVLPGGYGTLDELFEILAWSQLKIFVGPVILINLDGYYDDLISFLERATNEGFLASQNKDLLKVVVSLEEAFDELAKFSKSSLRNKPLDESLYLTKS